MGEDTKILFGQGTVTGKRSEFQQRVVRQQLESAGHKGKVTKKDRALETLGRRAAAQDIRGRKSEAELHKAKGQLEIDTLTGKLNRKGILRILDEQITEARRTGENIYVFVADLDQFKGYNDTHGHIAGDHALRSAALLFQGEARGGDSIGRWGGDEFVIIMKTNDEHMPNFYTERIQMAFDKFSTTMNTFSEIEASLGCVTYNGKEPVDAQTLFNRADIAMTHSKLKEGTALTMWEPTMKRVHIPASRR